MMDRDSPANMPTKKTNFLRVVGIGASAGGLEALSQLLPLLKPDGRSVYIIAQHMARDGRIDLHLRLLQGQSSLRVVEANGNDLLIADQVYLLPPGATGIIHKGHIQLLPISSGQLSTPSVNALFKSIAGEAREHAVGIILSGAGRDGLSGCREIKAYKGRVIVQNPASAQHDGMPSAVIAAGLADQVLVPEQIAPFFYDHPDSLPTAAHPDSPDITLSQQDTLLFKRVIQMVMRATGNDFSQYKKETLWRRLNRRMSRLKIASLADYLTYLEKYPDELPQLQYQFLISLSSFFRDHESFSVLEPHVHNLVKGKAQGDSIRIWVPGCAFGEECYSWAILLIELLGNRRADFNINIIGSDLNEQAIAIANQGSYGRSSLDEARLKNINEYFDVSGEELRVKPAVRKLCQFHNENIIDHHPSELMDAVSCRNLLIYLNSELQDKLIRTFYDLLQPGGLLFLGQSETIGLIGNTLFTPLDHYHRVYRSKKVKKDAS